MSDDTQATSTEEPKKRKRGKRKAIYVMVPHDIDDLSKVRLEALQPEEDEEGNLGKVEATELPSDYKVYIVPGGIGQKEAILGILKKHNIDLKNIDRVRMFKGEKKFRVETQYNIRF